MADRKKSSRVRATSTEDVRTSMFNSLVTTANRDLGRSDLSVGTDADKKIVVLPFPSLALCFLYQLNGYPLSRIKQITGEEGSLKSTYLWECMRWHFINGGFGLIAENENKDGPELRHALFRWTPLWLSRLGVKPTYVLEEWQDFMTTTMGAAKTQSDGKNSPGRITPICWGVDSILGTSARDTNDKTEKDGFSSRGFALEAQLVTRYMRTMPERLQDFPFSVIGTNHLKPGTDNRGLPKPTVSGGKSVKFHETFEIEMAKVANADIDNLGHGGLRIQLTSRKNSLGASRKRIQAEVLWWREQDPKTGEWKLQAAWDWHTATVVLLQSFEIANGKKTLYNKLQEICDIRVVQKGARLAYSKTLGVGSKDSPVKYSDIGAALQARPDLLKLMYPLLGIATRKIFQPGEDYRNTVAAPAAATAGDVATQYVEPDMPHMTDEDMGGATQFDPECPELPADPSDVPE